ncbi:NAD(P)-binding protein [Gymnopus androsaceus JB14]|uniref:NAD(P)-binding protein n=1 Tax=Gymnopus androsaceus JB14 TaxID=1447944 RepID=A0A6A4H6D0_9AGAR|nr:NAD(P)-binding protein [Gymnopus androsaceus JB14]
MSSNEKTTNSKFTAKNLFNMSDWTCVVTGGGTGIGLMISQAVSNVVNTWGSSLAHTQGQLIAIECDITDKKSISNLLNNAGVTFGRSDVTKGDESAEGLSKELFESEDIEKWEDVYRTNVVGYFFMTAAFIPLLAATSSTHRGRTAAVINITSISGITRTSQHQFKYNVSKGAAIHLNTLLAQELRRNAVNVRVNSVAPGIFPSDEMNKSSILTGEDYGEKKGIPTGRPGEDEDMAQAVVMLACNQYAYGQTIAVEGGYLLEHP